MLQEISVEVGSKPNSHWGLHTLRSASAVSLAQDADAVQRGARRSVCEGTHAPWASTTEEHVSARSTVTKLQSSGMHEKVDVHDPSAHW